MKTYTILEIAKELNTNKERIRKTLNKLNIEAENEKTRTHNNIAKVYSLKSKELVILELSQDLGVNNAPDSQFSAPESKGAHHNLAQETQFLHQNAPESTDYAPDSQFYASGAQDEIIKLLKSQLEDKDKQLDKSYQEKQDLIRSLNESQQLVNQQQQLSFQANKKISILELELKEVLLEEEIEHKDSSDRKWYHIFKRRK